MNRPNPPARAVGALQTRTAQRESLSRLASMPGPLAEIRTKGGKMSTLMTPSFIRPALSSSLSQYSLLYRRLSKT